MDVKVSILVAIYQSEETLRRCLDSVLSQSLQEWELLLVDDGSTDNSVVICEEYARSDVRIKVHRKKHSGLSDTRQFGFNLAVGEFVICCDTDDWMESNMLELLYEKACETNADIVVCDFFQEYENKSIVYREFSNRIDQKDVKNRYLSLSYSLCDKLVRRSFMRAHSIEWLEGINYAEDLYVTLQLLNKSPYISYIPIPMYHYNRNSSKSITTNFSMEWIVSHKRVTGILSNVLSDSLLYKLNINKQDFILSVYNTKALSISQIRNLYPEVHESILYSSVFHFEYLHLALAIYGWKSVLYVPKLFVVTLKKIINKILRE